MSQHKATRVVVTVGVQCHQVSHVAVAAEPHRTQTLRSAAAVTTMIVQLNGVRMLVSYTARTSTHQHHTIQY